ncbi:TAF5-like RNA polymerase II p300/CBP-associated factor-associated factor 65 kDa subunit 5L [Patiria miniata]|uniref:TFIID subunit TAF5 NTD2 domain-containing protein n=1 Tax=Patiria miniata TaxID=46514 RepID=A0A914ACY2_PATMI|nr:TAF5-like RNA polymerase II p300/CBP-associated factor-associated factor 65 kDa subunit 5L [Patiria miniata]
MKRVNSEQVHSAVFSYLKRRQFIDASSETYSKKHLRLTESVSLMATEAAVRRETGVLNVVSCTTCDSDPESYEQQYSRLKTFIEQTQEPYKDDLSLLLYPLFVHLFLDMITNGHKSAAHILYSKHHESFLDVSSQRELVQSLTGVVNSMDLLMNDHLTAFRDSKYVVPMCQEAVQFLLRYLQSRDNSMLLKVFNLHIQIDVRGLSNGSSHLHNDNGSAPASAPVTTGSSQSASSDGDAAASLTALKANVEKVSKGPPTLPSVLMYTFNNSFQGLSCATVSADRSLLCGGFEDSSIQVWSLNSKKLRAAPHSVDVSRVHVAGDCVEGLMYGDSIGSESKTLRAHSGPVYGTCFLPDNKVLLSCSEDTTVRAWSMETFTNVAIYRGHNYPVWGIESSPMGLYFATASKDNTARLWTLERTFPLRIFVGHLMDVDCVKFHPNCKYLATGSSDKTIRLWNIHDGKTVRLFNGHRGTVLALAVSPDGRYIASAGEDRRVKLWDIGSGSLVKELRGHTDCVYSLGFSPDSSTLASGGIDNSLRLWDVRQNYSSSQSEGGSSSELLGSFSIKSTSIHHVQFSSATFSL